MSGASPMQFLFPIALVAIFYFLIILPQSKEKKRVEKMLAALKKGDKVVTSSGILAEVSAIKDDKTLTLKIAEGVKIDILRSAITQVTSSATSA